MVQLNKLKGVMSKMAIIAIITVCFVGAVNAQTQPKQQGIEPLIVVDGVEGGNMTKISPENIISISVLKARSAVAVYGERGKNGVIIITTKDNQSKKVDATSKDNAPLIVVDGVEEGNMTKFSPENIESISVLKAHSAVAVYGERGKSGVIIITMKK